MSLALVVGSVPFAPFAQADTSTSSNSDRTTSDSDASRVNSPATSITPVGEGATHVDRGRKLSSINAPASPLSPPLSVRAPGVGSSGEGAPRKSVAKKTGKSSSSKGSASKLAKKPSDRLKVDGLPEIPESLANELSRYTNFRSATIADWHPTKREMLIITNLTGTTQVHKVEMPGGARFQLTFEKDNVLWFGATTRTASFDPLEGKFLIFSKDIGGTEDNQTYRYDFDSGKITLLTDGKARNTPGVWSNSLKFLAYESTRRNGMDTDLYVMDPRDPGSDRLVSVVGGGGWHILDWSPDDSKLLVRKYRSVNESYLWSFDTTTGSAELIIPKDGSLEIAYKDAQFSKDGRGLYVLTDKDSEFLRLAYLDIATGEHTFLTPEDDWNVDKMLLSKDRSKIAYTTNENGISVLHVLSLDNDERRTFEGMSPGIVSALQWHSNGVDLGFSFDSRKSPHDAYSINTDTGIVERWTTSETGGVNAENFDEPEVVKWKSEDGLEFSGYLYRPPGRKEGERSPVIIYFHGGPEGQYRPGFIGRSNYFINELGIAMIYPNIRGSTGYGKTFAKLDDGMLRSNAYLDIKAVLDWVKKQPEFDADRVMIMGRSYGGYMALAGAVNYSDMIRCAIDVVGPSNLVTFLENTSGYRQNLRRAEYGDERSPPVRSYLEKIAPLNRADEITKPLLIIQGANDPRVPESESRQMVKRVKKVGVPIWYLVVEGAGHKFKKKPLIDMQFYTMVMFIKKYLLPVSEPSNPSVSPAENPAVKPAESKIPKIVEPDKK